MKNEKGDRMGLMEKILGDMNTKEVKKIEKIADKVMALEEATALLSDDELRGRTEEFKKRVQEGERLLRCAVKAHGEA